MSRRAMVLLAILLAAIIAGGALAASEYELSASPSVDVPERTVTYNEENYTVTAIARTEPDGTITISSTVPGDTLHTVYLYNNEEMIEDEERGYGNLEFTVDAETLSEGPGSYMVVLEKDTIQTVHPVVVAEYRVSLSTPDSTTEGASIDVSGDITTLVENESDPEVTIVLSNNSERVQTSATLDSAPPNTSFSASIQTDGLSPGTYSVFAGVRGPETVSGNQELIGLSDAHTVEITASSSQDGGGGQESTTTTTTPSDSTPTTSTATTTTTTSTPTESTTTQTATPTPTSSTTQPTTTTTTGGETPSKTPTTDSEVVTPKDTTTRGTTTTETPLFRPSTVAAFLLALALLAYRTRP